MFQDTFNQLFCGKSVAERGTLCQLKNDFGHRNVTSDVMNCFNFADNFLRFITEAHVVCLTLKLCGMTDVDSEPSDVDDTMTDDDRRHYLAELSSRVVQSGCCRRCRRSPTSPRSTSTSRSSTTAGVSVVKVDSLYYNVSFI